MHNQEAFSGPKTVAVVAAAGVGLRLGAPTPKQFLLLGGKPILRWSVDALLAGREIAAIAVVAAPGEIERTRSVLPADHRILVVPGGAVRTQSVRNGLEALADLAPELVLIHDAARPGLSGLVIRELIAALASHDAAAPALPMTDAVKERAGQGLRSVARDQLVRVQTPQAFRFDIIRNAIASGAEAVDDLALVEAAGARIVLTPGRAELMKITHAEDMAVVEKLIANPQATSPSMRVGSGFDVHGFAPGDHVTICGLRIPHTHSLEGHSDADVAWHALTDAILGAAALGDIGQHFPPSDPKWKGAASILFLQHAQKLAAEKGLRILNADITVICERPKISPHREAMRVSTAEALSLSLDLISIKATTTEKLGFLGREEGMAAQAVVMLGA